VARRPKAAAHSAGALNERAPSAFSAAEAPAKAVPGGAGYVGAVMIFAGMALSLASWWALIPAVWASLILIVRTKWEDDLLRTELEGYSEYAKRMRYRLFPHLW
jgi:UDP-N-acetylmuramyl pentapeptide phosphotransferase/UDP-N-acetylglucosamine-1-phosphate transferase